MESSSGYSGKNNRGESNHNSSSNGAPRRRELTLPDTLDPVEYKEKYDHLYSESSRQNDHQTTNVNEPKKQRSIKPKEQKDPIDVTPKKRMSGLTNSTNELSELIVDKLQITTGGNDNRYVYFIHQKGSHGQNVAVRVGASNNVAQTRRDLENPSPYDLKTHRVIECLNGDADRLLNTFRDKYSDRMIARDWYTLSKEIIDKDTDELVKLNSKMQIVSEARAKIKR